MDPVTLAALAGASANAGGGILNSISQLFTNRRNRQFSREMYSQTYNDNIDFWNKQNEYNSPSAQMERFKTAGLNPNLVFGAGNPGNAGSIPTPDVQSAPARSPEFGNALTGINGLSMLSAIADLDIKQAQTDNLKEQANILREETQLKSLQKQSAEIDLGYKPGLMAVNMDAQRENLRKTRQEIDFSVNENARRAAQNAASVQEAAERMLSMQTNRKLTYEQIKNAPVQRQKDLAETRRINQSIQLMLKDGTAKDFDNDLRRQGLNPNDPTWTRLVARFLTDASGETRSLGTLGGSVWDYLFK